MMVVKSFAKSVSFAIVVTIFLTLTAFAVFKMVHDHSQREAVASGEVLGRAKEGARVKTVSVTRAASERIDRLVGETRPFASVVLYSKVSGYVKEIRVDKGEHVRKDQILAVLDSPETEKAYDSALIDYKYKFSVARRARELRKRKMIAEQELEQALMDSDMARLKVESIMVQKNYNTIRAPFDGTVTARFVDPGALVQSAMANQNAQPIVTLSDLDSLRIYVYVNQRDASFVRTGTEATVSFVERPGLQLKAKVARVAGELDSKTKTLLTELDIDNRQLQVFAGGFVNVVFRYAAYPLLQVPAESLVMQKELQLLPVIDRNNILHYREVKVVDTDGKMLSISEGVKEGELVALSIGNRLAEGTFVQPSLAETGKSAETSQNIRLPSSLEKGDIKDGKR